MAAGACSLADGLDLFHALRLLPFPKLSTVMEPIKRLTKQDVEFKWSEEQDKAMAEIKKLVTTAPILAYYDPKKELVIQCDAVPPF